VWQRSHQLVLKVYEVTASFPRGEQYGLTSQLRRAASSVPANIAEGCGRDGNAELARFCRIAAGSLTEVEYHLLLAKDLGFLGAEHHQLLDKEVADIRRMLSGFQRRLATPSVGAKKELETGDW
jgi:four helix bundle protein